MKCLYQHICRVTTARVYHAQLTAKMITDIIREDVEKDQTITIKQVHGLIRNVYPGVNPKYNKLWHDKEIVVSYVFGSWSGSYALLPQLLNVIISSNPGSRLRILSDSLPQFGVRLFKCAVWAFAPCIEAFLYLRPVISIDASHLRGRYDGRFLIAVGYDAEINFCLLHLNLLKRKIY
jgi:hypothetical protein